ncbi:hypothetical protein [Bariatricus sp. HCP28S3_D3]|uniref:hypothetical protein n=1 Tax=Bariatricus sp. HCP28S3_D3 TaxID=3438901 RepID=UPI003F8B8911
MKKSLVRVVHILCSILSICVLITPEVFSEIVSYLACGMLLSIVVFIFYDRLQWGQYIQKKFFSIDLIIIILLAYDFHTRWIPSSMVAVIAGTWGLSSSVFLWLVAGTLGAMAIGTVNWVVSKISKFAEKIVGNKEYLYNYFFILLIFILQYLSLQYSSLESLKMILRQDVSMVFLNILIVLAVNMVMILFLQKWRISLCVTSIIVCIWSIANYYVILFHGSPLYISELVNNTETAFEVIATYDYHLSIVMIFSIIILMAELEYIFKYSNFPHQ